MKVLIASSIHPSAIERLQEQHDVITCFNAKEEELKALLPDREVLIFRSGVQFPAEVLAYGTNLKKIIRAGSGVDNIDLNYVKAHGLDLVRIPGPGAKAVSELSFALMLALARNLTEANRLTQQGHWAKKEMTGYLLTGKVLGIIGTGNIGSQVAKKGVAWGMRVLGCVEHPSPERAEGFRQQGIELVDCGQVLSQADYVSIHVPLKTSTRYLIDEKALARMKSSAFLVNLARGGVVDEKALLAALQSGRLRGAALDVHEAEGEGKVSPLAGLPNVILTPHMGAGTFDSQREIGEIIVQTVNSYTLEKATPTAAV